MGLISTKETVNKTKDASFQDSRVGPNVEQNRSEDIPTANSALGPCKHEQALRSFSKHSEEDYRRPPETPTQQESSCVIRMQIP